MLHLLAERADPGDAVLVARPDLIERIGALDSLGAGELIVVVGAAPAASTVARVESAWLVTCV